MVTGHHHYYHHCTWTADVECHVPVQRRSLVEVSDEDATINNITRQVLQDSSEVSLDLGVAQSDCSVNIVLCVVWFYLR